MAKQIIANNVVKKEVLRDIQSDTLRELSGILVNSFGPDGSNTCVKKENALSRYTKDGHTIIGSIHYNGIIEQSIKDDVESITRHIVKTVGDGTTSAVILSSKIFEVFRSLEGSNYQPATIVREFERVVDILKDNIKETAEELTLDDVYNIAMISTNGNEYISKTLVDIYKEFGMSVFIDVSPSTGEDLVIKSYNGMTLNTGYCDSCYVTDTKNNTAVVDRPEVYFFEHPIDTVEMGQYLDAILVRNIMAPMQSGAQDKVIPTVIYAPKISQDVAGTMDQVASYMASAPVANKLPICFITDLHEMDQLDDLVKMCGAKFIRKYIDPKIYQLDVEAGRAPTVQTIEQWAGFCDRVVAYSDKTTFINPSLMYDSEGNNSELYNNLVNFLEIEVSKAKENGEDARTIGTLKRRLHSLKSNMVELLVGGITQADRDALRDLVEDAVLNIRSAADNGVGYGANMSGTIAAYDLARQAYDADAHLENEIVRGIYKAYCELNDTLYDGIRIEEATTAEEYIEYAKESGKIYNIRTKAWTDDVKTSIMSDITILDTVVHIVSLMATCNQFIVPTAMHNIYMD